MQEPRGRPIQGTTIRNNSPECEGGNGIDERLYSVDLDADRPVLGPPPPDASEEGPPVTFPYRVTHRDPEVIRAEASTLTCDCRWVLELVYVDGTRENVKVIDDGGTPFRTTGLPGRQSVRGG